ncbi:MAG: site-specific DNA-methyltransferase [Bacteroidales bacterium]|nr:site-specific DNA-methyltransferase [Bacteroidales bacterium]
MTLMKDSSVHLIITSPPYWQLKDYDTQQQIGFNDSYEDYINNLNMVWSECNRILHDGCRLCINIGDQFARSVYYGRYKVIPIRTEIIRFCESIGLDYMGAIIWQKQTSMHTTGGAVVMGSYPYPRNGIVKIDYEFILIFKKQGKAPQPTKQQKELSAIDKQEWNNYFSSHWNFVGAKQDGHIAVFPEELPHRLIKMFSFVGETVFDPFMGSGTTALAAKNLQRNSIGYEINDSFKDYYKQKVCSDGIFEDSIYDFLQDTLSFDYQKNIQSLPYLFKDNVKMEKKIDPKTMQFGSKIDKNSSQREDYYSVKDVLAPNLLKLNNDLVIKLLGIEPIPSMVEKANIFIKEKTKGHRVYMRFDDIKHDDKNNLLCYLYLENKMFINAHLLKEKLVLPDTSIDYKYKNKFINY